MTQELLECAHCKGKFLGTKAQVRVSRSSKGKSHKFACSKICWLGLLGRPRKVRPTYGPCPTCQKMFESAAPRRFCSIRCYTQAPETLARLRSQAQKALEIGVLKRTGKALQPPTTRKCPQCKKEFTLKASSRKKYCSNSCRRKYFADRFDRWIANPKTIALPQAYDEFLAENDLQCLIDGCEWIGQHLSNHMNFAHGVTADEVKRAAGFNIHTGLVGMALHETLCAREHIHHAPGLRAKRLRDVTAREVSEYRSLEGAEHRAKARAVALAETPRPTRVCRGCGVSFVQTTPFGRPKYCSVKCRRQHAPYR